MRLPPAPDGRMGEWQRQIERADDENLKRGRDIEMGAGRVILRSPNGTRFALTVDDSGTLTATEV